MLSTLIIVFREVLEAMLVVGIATAAAREANIATRWIYGGIAAGLIAAIVVALFADMLSASMQGMGQEILNAAVLIAASLMMAWTAIWMGKHGREMSQKIRRTCQDVQGRGTAKIVLSIVVALAVAREGSEVVLFLYGVAAAGDAGASDMLAGGAAGMLLGIMVALGLYQSLIHVPLRYVFLVVTYLIMLLSAGMASQGVAWLVMIDMLPALGQTVWDTSGIISQHEWFGQLLHALMGYDDRPSGMQVLVFVSVLSLTWLAIRRQKKAMKAAPKKAATTAAIVMLAATGACMLPADTQAKQVYSPIVEQGELELEYLLDYSVDSDPTKNGSARHQFELEYGVTDRWMTAVYGDFRKKPGQKFTYHGFKWENIYQLFEQGEHWLDAGLYVEYSVPKKSLNQPNGLEFKLLLEKQQGRLIHTGNLILKKELGTNAGNKIGVGYAWRSKWRWKRYLEPAIELYGSLGDVSNTKPLSLQSHLIGPVVIGKLRNGLTYELGYLFGLTTASDQGHLKFILGYEF